MPSSIDRRALKQLARDQCGSSVAQSAAVALVAMVLIGSLLSIVPALGGQVEHVMRCLIASLGGGASCSGGATVDIPPADPETPALAIVAGGPGEAVPIHLPSGGNRRPNDDMWDGLIAHWEITDYFTDHIRPGTDWDVPIRGSGPKGGTGYADLVHYDEQTGVYQVWEIKPNNPYWVKGAGQDQLNRYVERLPNAKPGQIYEFVMPVSFDPDLVLVVTSLGQPGMLYYEYKRRDRDKPKVWPPIPIPTDKKPKDREKAGDRTRPPIIVIDNPLSDIFEPNDDQVIVLEVPLDNPVIVGGGAAAAGGILVGGYTFWRRRRRDC